MKPGSQCRETCAAQEQTTDATQTEPYRENFFSRKSDTKQIMHSHAIATEASQTEGMLKLQNQILKYNMDAAEVLTAARL